MARLCSASGEVRWAPDPFAAPLQALPVDSAEAHGVHCALCLPSLWLGPQGAEVALLHLRPVQRVAAAAAQCGVCVALLPPVRGPPWVVA